MEISFVSQRGERVRFPDSRLAAAVYGLVIGGVALLPGSAQAHTDALGFLLTDGSTTGVYNVQIFYGSWHACCVTAAEGALDLRDSTPTLIGTQPFSLVMGPVSAGTVPTGLVPGTNYFFPDTTTAPQGDLTGNAASHPIYYFQATTFLNLSPGSYTFGYNAGSSFTVNWEPSDTAINNGSFIIAANGTLGGVGGAGPIPNNIDPAEPSYASSDLGALVNPAFEGGVLLIDEVAPTYGQNFTLDDSGTNRIDLAGNSVNFTGVFSDTTVGEAGGIIVNDSIAGGTAVLAGVNTYTGGTTVNAGTLTVAGAGTLGANSGSTTVAGGLLDLGATTQTQAALLQSGGVVQHGGIAVTDYQLTGGVLAANATVTATTEFDLQAGTLNGVLAGAGALTKSGSGTVTVAGSNSYLGGTAISAGALNVTGSGTLGSANGSTAVTGGVLDLGGTAQTQASLNQSAGVIQNGALGVADYQLNGGTLSATAVVAATHSFDLRGGTVDGLLTGTAGLAKTGNGTLTLAGANSYSGGTAVVAGSVILAGAGTLGASGATTTVSDGVLDLGGTAQVQSVLNQAGGVVQNGAMAVNAYELDGGTLAASATVTAVDSLDLHAGVVNGVLAGAAGLVKSTGASVTLAAENTFTGDTTIDGGTLALSGVGSVSQSSTVANDGLLDIAATTAGTSITNLTGTGTVELGSRTLTLTAAAGAFSGDINGTGGLTLAGGFKALSGISTYTGDTAVTAGELRVDNRLGDTRVTVGSGATLSGSGEIGGDVLVLSGGTLAPGQSPGTLELGSLTLNSGSISVFELGAPGVVGGPLNDLVNVAGPLVLGGTLDATVASAGQYRLFNAGSVSGTFATVDLTAPTVPGASWLVYTNESGGGSAVEVNLGVLGGGQTQQFWDGADSLGNGTVDGGTGTWNSTFTNWTGPPGQAAVNAPTANSIAVFQSTPGIVTVAGLQGFDTLVFNTGGYLLAAGTGGALAMNREGVIDVDVGTATLALAVVDGSQSQLTKEGPGTLVLSGTNSWSGGTLIATGTLQLGSGGTTGSLLGNVANSGTLAFKRSDDVLFTGAIAGSGNIAQGGTGSTTLGASNTYAGGTTITAGTLIGSAASFGTGPIVNGAALIIDQSGNAAFDNSIQGTGSLTKRGAGTLTLSGSSSLTGATRVASGVLAVPGFLGTSQVSVDSGATLTGAGTIGGLTVRTGATLAAGNAGLGTLAVNGGVIQESGSIWQLQIASTGATDAVTATGPATIANGAILQVNKLDAGRYQLGARYLVLSAAGGVSGIYTLTGDTRVSAFFNVVGAYDAAHAYLDVVQARSFTAAGGTRNQIAAAAGIDRLGLGNQLFNAMGYLQSDAEVAAALDQVSGELHASAQAAAVEDSRFVREAALNRVRAGFGDPGAAGDARLAQSAVDGPATWGQAFGSWGRSDDDGNGAQLDRSIGGFFLGSDVAPVDGIRLGGLAGYSRSDIHAAARASRGTSDNYHLAIYGGREWGALELRAGAGYSIHGIDTRRAVTFSGYSDNLRASYDARTAQVFGELGYSFARNAMTLEPYASVAYVSLHTAALVEQGGPAALAVPEETLAVPFSTVGLHASSTHERQVGSLLTLHATLAWRHAYDDVVATSRVAFAGGTGFDVAGVPIARDVAVVELGLDGTLVRGMALGLSYSGQAGDGSIDHGVKALFKWDF
ncbi:MAG: autotransporter domain-containing protein [Pseudomonadota bacterium]